MNKKQNDQRHQKSDRRSNQQTAPGNKKKETNPDNPSGSQSRNQGYMEQQYGLGIQKKMYTAFEDIEGY